MILVQAALVNAASGMRGHTRLLMFMVRAITIKTPGDKRRPSGGWPISFPKEVLSALINRDWSLSHPSGSLRDRDPVRIGGSG